MSIGPNRAVLLLLVATYVAVSIVGEIAPNRLLQGTPADEAEIPAAGNRGLQKRNSANAEGGGAGADAEACWPSVRASKWLGWWSDLDEHRA